MRYPPALSTREDVRLAVRLALEAGEIIREIAAAGFETHHKDGQGPVTEADRRADAHIKGALLREFPDDGVLTEEGGAESVRRRRVWVVDPLDGTRAFVKGIPGYSVMIGRLDDGAPALGVVYDPVDDRLFAAASGAGAWRWEADRAHPLLAGLPAPGSPEDAVFVTTPSVREPALQPWLRAGGFRETIGVNSVGIKVGELLRGRGAVYYSGHGLNYWDTVAPLALALEAGAVARAVQGPEPHYDFTGPPDSWRHPEALLVGRPERVEAVLAAYRAAA